MLERVIFAIDNDNDTHVVAKFMRHVDTLRAMGKIDPVVQLIGCYKGQLEKSYMIRADQLHNVREYIRDQESILRVPGDVRQPCVLEFVSGGERVSLGPMGEVSASDALQFEAWTYNPSNGKYFVCG